MSNSSGTVGGNVNTNSGSAGANGGGGASGGGGGTGSSAQSGTGGVGTAPGGGGGGGGYGQGAGPLSDRVARVVAAAALQLANLRRLLPVPRPPDLHSLIVLARVQVAARAVPVHQILAVLVARVVPDKFNL